MATITNSLSTNGVQVVLQSNGGALNIGTAADATVLTLGNITGATAVNINTGTAGHTVTTTNGVFSVLTGTGAVSISGDASNTTVGLATGAGVKLLTLGSTSGASSVTINTGSAGINIPSFTTSGALVSTSAGVITDATASTAGFILTSNGSGSAPSFQANAVTQGIVTIDGSTGSVTGTTVSIEGTNSNIVTAGSGTAFTIALANSPSVSGTVTAGTGIVATTGGLTATAGGLTVTAGTVTITPFASFGALVTNTSGVVTDAASTAGYVLTGNSGSVPTFQAVSAIGAVVTVDGNSGSASPASGIITISGSGPISSSGSGSTLALTTTAANVINASTGSATASSNAFTIVGAGGITTSATGATVTITGSATGTFNWNNTTGATQAIAINNGYVSNDASTLVTFTLPATAAIGSQVAVVGSGSGLWTIAQNAGQTIHFNAVSSTTGVTGSVSSTSQYDSVTLICNIANSDWVVYQATGNLSVA